MFKSLRVPERLFQIAMWAVSLVFANFLIGLGGKVVGDLPGVEQDLRLEQFIDTTAMAAVDAQVDSLRQAERAGEGERERSALTLAANERAYSAARESFSNWIATRTATTNAEQDPEVIARTRALDTLGAAVEDAEDALGVLDVNLLRMRQQQEALVRQADDVRDAGRDDFEAALFWHELKIFGFRLALTLPLLLIAGWMIARKRKSDYWPLFRGFVLFALVAFFVELVPYLPSYGGYVRYGVGIIASALAGLFAIRSMRRYLARRQEEATRTEVERRQALGYEEALKRMGGGVCPGCERAIAGGGQKKGGVAPDALSNFCVHCGMMLFNHCHACETRKNAFFQFCPTCGVTAADPGSAREGGSGGQPSGGQPSGGQPPVGQPPAAPPAAGTGVPVPVG